MSEEDLTKLLVRVDIPDLKTQVSMSNDIVYAIRAAVQYTGASSFTVHQ